MPKRNKQQTNYLPMNSRLADGFLFWGGAVMALVFILGLIKVWMKFAEVHRI